MYSKSDQKFYLPAPRSHDLFSYDLHFKEEFHELQFRNFPESVKSELELFCFVFQDRIPCGVTFTP